MVVGSVEAVSKTPSPSVSHSYRTIDRKGSRWKEREPSRVRGTSTPHTRSSPASATGGCTNKVGVSMMIPHAERRGWPIPALPENEPSLVAKASLISFRAIPFTGSLNQSRPLFAPVPVRLTTGAGRARRNALVSAKLA